MNYLTKKNFGIPAGILAALSVLLGYSLYAGGVSTVLLVFVAVVFLFDFDENVKSMLKQSLILAFIGRLVKMLISMLGTVLSWFSNASISDSEGIRTTYKVFNKIYEVATDLVGFVFIFLFVSLLAAAIKNKTAKIGFLTASVEAAEKESVACSKCGAPVEKGAAFCTKCGNKMN
ncbi:MAG: zinc ribbon domain-containing protein [Lachnospiraceae bacterium]|nr:zinc ribbon domain-containing protein [Lachnospiraceae bacterium]